MSHFKKNGSGMGVLLTTISQKIKPKSQAHFCGIGTSIISKRIMVKFDEMWLDYVPL